jgi:hypothetical protein
LVKTFLMKLDRIQPSQLYISREKLNQVLKGLANPRSLSIKPIPLATLGNEVIFLDGHTRALAVFLRGASDITVCWEDEEIDWEMYKICVEWCKEEGIRSIADLERRIVSQENYETLWIQRCRSLEQELDKKRGKKIA